MQKISKNLWIKYSQHVNVSDITVILSKVCSRWAVSILLSTAMYFPSLHVASLGDNFMARSWTKPWWHSSQKSESPCPQWTTAASMTVSQGWITSCAEFNELPNASKCQKVQRKMHSTERGTDRKAETEINSLASSISQLIFHEGFSPSPPPVFFQLWNDQSFPRGR